MPSKSVSRRSLIVGMAGIAVGQASKAQTHGTGPLARARFDIDRFVEDVQLARVERDGQSAIEEVLRRAVSRPAGILAAVGEPLEAGIHTIFRHRDLTILNVVWAPMMVLLPHNHGMWASIGIYTGREDNIFWERQRRSVTAAGAASLSEKQVLGLPIDAIHSVTNPIGRLTGAIHIYGGDFFAPGRSEWDPETLRERPWDTQAARTEFEKAANRFKAVP